MTGFNAADVVILGVLALSMLFGALRGFVSEVLGLVIWIAAFGLAWVFGGMVAPYFAPWLHNHDACLVAGYLSCFAGVLIAGALLGWILRRFLTDVGLRGVDRFLGLLFGLARGMLLLVFAVFVLGFTPVPRDAAWWHQSLLLPRLQETAGLVAAALPPNVIQRAEVDRQALPSLPAIPTSALPKLSLPALESAVPAGSAPAQRAAGHGSTHGDVGQ